LPAGKVQHPHLFGTTEKGEVIVPPGLDGGRKVGDDGKLVTGYDRGEDGFGSVTSEVEVDELSSQEEAMVTDPIGIVGVRGGEIDHGRAFG
jgi:hypothetical protein